MDALHLREKRRCGENGVALVDRARAGKKGVRRQAVGAIAAADPTARVLICGSLYLAGAVLRENG
ncbi:hypothetical protein CVM52_15010 [Pseudooceanicola lipolyticus]|uniref:Bifunctional folylpolyglutamate synthase/dihydrofolate synthase n=1 Tax=Pseudooceanicola lipolyticus TaxID=2029104 RepID=A0A2M8IZB6_9RHOB|nr:hypothetical protein CVM52_15010 [Pseudooceanicola lipolyticus]